MTVCYLDVDDEITNAVARLRGADEGSVVLVLPPGSRIATSRINFRLLAREAGDLGRRLSIVSHESGVRQVAVSAGVPAYGSLGDWRDAQGAVVAVDADGGDDADASGTDRPAASEGAPAAPPPDTTAMERRSSAAGRDAAADARAAAGGAAVAGAAAGAGGAGTVAGTVSRSLADGPARQFGSPGRIGAPPPVARPASTTPARPREVARPTPREAWLDDRADERRRGLGRRGAIAAVLALVVLLAALGGAAAYVVLPRAEITLTPRGAVAGPVILTVRADPAAEQVDARAGVVPAHTVEIPLSVSGEFPSSGVEVTTTRARGSVRFSNYDFTSTVRIPSGSIVSTDSNVRFATSADIVVPRGTLSLPGATVTPGTADVEVRAASGGEEGNVPANAIDNVPEGQNPDALTVANPAATAGGTRTEKRFAQQSDYDGAVTALRTQLEAALAAKLADPATTPAGLRLFAETAQRTDAVAEPAADAVVAQEVERFTLALTASATVTAVDERELEPLAVDRLRADVTEGSQLFDDSVRSSHDGGTVDGQTVVYRVEAQGEQWRPIDGEKLLQEVRGLPLAEAQSRLEAHGQVAIEAWPDWVGTVPTLEGRSTLTVLPPQRLSP
jgi:hypothetical protein